jgi:FkbM family methyltransferase
MKSWFIKKCPDWLFVPISNTYYALSSKEKVKITKVNDKWLAQKGEIKLLSPTPKFLGFGLNVFENKCERFFKIENGDTVLDVGACIGDTTIPMAIKTGSTGKVIAVEPHPTNIEYLKLNLKEFRDVEIIDKAVWNEKGTIRFNVHDTPTGHSIIPHKERSSYIEVQCDTLDNMFADRKIDFAKIDAQGAEVQVLEGGVRFLRTTRKLIVETHDHYDEKRRTFPRVIKILTENGYETRLTMGFIVHAWK